MNESLSQAFVNELFFSMFLSFFELLAHFTSLLVFTLVHPSLSQNNSVSRKGQMTLSYEDKLKAWLRENNLTKYEDAFIREGFGMNDFQIFAERGSEDAVDEFIKGFISDILRIRNRFGRNKIFYHLKLKTMEYQRKCRQDATRRWLANAGMHKYETEFLDAGFVIDDIRLFVGEDDSFYRDFVANTLKIHSAFHTSKVLDFLKQNVRKYRRNKKRLEQENKKIVYMPARKKRKIEKQV